MAGLFIFAISAILIYCLCITYGKCSNHRSKHNSNPSSKFNDKNHSTSFKNRTRRRSQEMYSNHASKKVKSKIKSPKSCPKQPKMDRKIVLTDVSVGNNHHSKNKNVLTIQKRKSVEITVKKEDKPKTPKRVLSAKISPRNVLTSPGFGKRGDRNSYETIDSDDDVIKPVDMELIATKRGNDESKKNFHRKRRKHKQHKKTRNNSESTKYEAILTADPDPEEKQSRIYSHQESMSDSGSDEMLNEFSTQTQKTASESNMKQLQQLHSMKILEKNHKNKEKNASLKSINIKGIGTVPTNNDGQPIIINIHHNHVMGDPSLEAFTDKSQQQQNISNSSIMELQSAEMYQDNNIAAAHCHNDMNQKREIFRRSNNNNNNNNDIPGCLPKLPLDISDTETEIRHGEGFNINDWIRQTLKECAPEDDEWKKYWSNFQKHKITEDTLIILSTDRHNKNDVWRELIPLIGPRVRFQEAWDKELLRQQQLKE